MLPSINPVILVSVYSHVSRWLAHSLYLDRAATKMQLSRNIMTPPFPGRILAVWDRKVVVATAALLLAPSGELISNVISSLPRRSRQLMARWDCD